MIEKKQAGLLPVFNLVQFNNKFLQQYLTQKISIFKKNKSDSFWKFHQQDSVTLPINIIDHFLVVNFPFIIREEKGNLFYNSHVTTIYQIKDKLFSTSSGPLTPAEGKEIVYKESLLQWIYEVNREEANKSKENIGDNQLTQPDNANLEVLGATEFLADGRAVIHARKSANPTTFVHELGLIFRRDLSDEDMDTVARYGGLKDGEKLRTLTEKANN